MGNDSNPKKLTATGTTTFNSCFAYGFSINKTLAGTLTINESGTAVAQFAIGTTPQMVHLIPNGVRYALLTAVLSGADDVTAFTRTV